MGSIEDAPAAKFAVACSGDALSIVKDFSAAYVRIVNET